ncbi:uncharacterized protein LOC144909065 [Branchiostoma floridae x Branchiostoma belcheri]
MYIRQYIFLFPNCRMAHGYFSSGILPNQYVRVCKNAGIGHLTEKTLKKSMILYAEIVQSMKEASMDRAMNEEIGDPADEEDVPDESVGIVTDARHAQRRNSHRSDIMALGQINHRVLAHMPVTKKEQTCTQKHEKVGTERLYRQLDEMESFNNSCLQYVDKRIVFGDLNYGLRMGLAVLDWHSVDADYSTH